MTIKEPEIYKIVGKIGDHYKNNVNNRFVRKALLVLDLPQAEWDCLDGLTTKSEYYKAQGFLFDELYEIVLAGAHLVFQARQKVMPNVKSLVVGAPAPGKAPPEQDRVLREMAARNLPMNLQILSDLVNELYVKTTDLDRQAHEKKSPVYEKIPELKELGRYLIQ